MLRVFYELLVCFDWGLVVAINWLAVAIDITENFTDFY